jgi:hypothetical protein
MFFRGKTTPEQLTDRGPRDRKGPRPPALISAGWAIGLLVLLLGNLTAHSQTSLSEHQVKALFLLKFVNYVNWPEAASDPQAPLVIGLVGADRFSAVLKQAISASNRGRKISIRPLSAEDEMSDCSILFISASEKSRLGAILGKIEGAPILTVGEDESFLREGGMVNLALKGGKISLEINLKAARQSKLQISSKLLSVANVVRE